MWSRLKKLMTCCRCFRPQTTEEPAPDLDGSLKKLFHLNGVTGRTLAPDQMVYFPGQEGEPKITAFFEAVDKSMPLQRYMGLLKRHKDCELDAVLWAVQFLEQHAKELRIVRLIWDRAGGHTQNLKRGEQARVLRMLNLEGDLLKGRDQVALGELVSVAIFRAAQAGVVGQVGEVELASV